MRPAEYYMNPMPDDAAPTKEPSILKGKSSNPFCSDEPMEWEVECDGLYTPPAIIWLVLDLEDFLTLPQEARDFLNANFMVRSEGDEKIGFRIPQPVFDRYIKIMASHGWVTN